jgi:hypothetical protein
MYGVPNAVHDTSDAMAGPPDDHEAAASIRSWWDFSSTIHAEGSG